MGSGALQAGMGQAHPYSALVWMMRHVRGTRDYGGCGGAGRVEVSLIPAGALVKGTLWQLDQADSHQLLCLLLSWGQCPSAALQAVGGRRCACPCHACLGAVRVPTPSLFVIDLCKSLRRSSFPGAQCWAFISLLIVFLM